MSDERTSKPRYQAKHPAAFINVIAEDGTKAEAIEWLQRTWDECQDLRKQALERPSAEPSDAQRRIEELEDALMPQRHESLLDWAERARSVRKKRDAGQLPDELGIGTHPSPREIDKRGAQKLPEPPNDRLAEALELLRRVWNEGYYVSETTMYLHEPLGTQIRDFLERRETKSSYRCGGKGHMPVGSKHEPLTCEDCAHQKWCTHEFVDFREFPKVYCDQCGMQFGKHYAGIPIVEDASVKPGTVEMRAPVTKPAPPPSLSEWLDTPAGKEAIEATREISCETEGHLWGRDACVMCKTPKPVSHRMCNCPPSKADPTRPNCQAAVAGEPWCRAAGETSAVRPNPTTCTHEWCHGADASVCKKCGQAILDGR